MENACVEGLILLGGADLASPGEVRDDLVDRFGVEGETGGVLAADFSGFVLVAEVGQGVPDGLLLDVPAQEVFAASDQYAFDEDGAGAAEGAGEGGDLVGAMPHGSV